MLLARSTEMLLGYCLERMSTPSPKSLKTGPWLVHQLMKLGLRLSKEGGCQLRVARSSSNCMLIPSDSTAFLSFSRPLLRQPNMNLNGPVIANCRALPSLTIALVHSAMCHPPTIGNRNSNVVQPMRCAPIMRPPSGTSFVKGIHQSQACRSTEGATLPLSLLIAGSTGPTADEQRSKPM